MYDSTILVVLQTTQSVPTTKKLSAKNLKLKKRIQFAELLDNQPHDVQRMRLAQERRRPLGTVAPHAQDERPAAKKNPSTLCLQRTRVGAPYQIRTGDPLFTRQMLWPAELRRRGPTNRGRIDPG